MKPFLKWVGGKRKIVPQILKLMPKEYHVYREPFLGGGALFFALQPKKAVLSDINWDLINCYLQVRDNVDCLVYLLSDMAECFRADRISYYKLVRDYHNLPTDIIKQPIAAARFIFLNKTCFNGLYRVNKQGRFNVPMGNYKNPVICDRETLLRCSQALQGIEIKHASFTQSLRSIESGDSIYADPPYVDSFIDYSSEGFGISKQQELYVQLKIAGSKGSNWIASNSNTELVRKIYQGCKFVEVSRSGCVNSNPNKRQKVTELLICS
jgi:DNA adenine methylase